MGEIEVNKPYGMDVVTVVASERQFTDLEDILKNTIKEEVTSNTRGALQIRSRGIGVVQPLSITKSVATDTCFIVSHSK